MDNERMPYVGYRAISSLVNPTTDDIIEPTPPLTPATTIFSSSISSPIDFRPLSPGFPWFLTTSKPACSSPVPNVDGVRLRDLFSPEFRTRYYSSSESSSDESDDIEYTFPGTCSNGDDQLHRSLDVGSDYKTPSASGDADEDVDEHDGEKYHQHLGSDEDSDSDSDYLVSDSSNTTTPARERNGKTDIPYVRRSLFSASPIEAVILPTICNPPLSAKRAANQKLVRSNKTRNARSSSIHKDRPKAAPAHDSEVNGNDYFSLQVHNGASYRSCEDVPFDSIMQMPFYGERRPPRPFTHMIALALLSSPSTNNVLSIEEIYQFISQRFPCFKMEASIKATKRWKSAVRHNLSFSSSFRKIATDSAPRKALPGGSKRCLWGFSLKSWEKQRLLRGHRGERLKKRK
ncbi:uncharacterized protein V1513DRAFT_450994 [Lipomyces chichibuensis]|uniref:uncharacterized protein n=1 Tax=Lipomyces chichibuensis TaxID=1546026 RepID=UPI003344042F